MKIHELKDKVEQRINHLKGDLATMRTGRANPSLIEDIKVEAYDGSPPLSIKELATVGVTEATTLTVRPWDLSILPKIEAAIRKAPGGLNGVAFDDTIRVDLPPLSLERRQEMAKIVRNKVEECKVEIRQIRQDEMRSIDEMETNGVISQDERFRTREEVEKIIKEKSIEVEGIGKDKEQELTKV